MSAAAKLQCTIVFQKNWNAITALQYDQAGNPVLDNNGVHQRKYRYIINEGSSRSSKTTSLIDCYDLYARSNKTKRLTAWRDTKTDCKKTVLDDALKHLKKTNRYKVGQDYNKTESVFSYNTGSTFEIHGTEDEQTVMGLNQSAAWLNEPYKISREVFDQIDQRTSDFIFLDWNPKKSHWIEELKKDPRAIVIHSTFRDNPFCPPEQRRKILSYQPVKFCAVVVEKRITELEAKDYDLVGNPLNFSDKELKELSRCRENEDKKSANAFNWQVYGLGTKSEKPNRIFHFEEISDEAYKQIDAPVYYGNDWGVVDPWGIVEVKYRDGELYLHEKHYLSENETRALLTMTELAQINAAEEGIVTWLFGKLGIDKRRPIICDNQRPLKIAALRRAGWQALPANKKPGSIIDGIDIVNNLRVYYTASSTNIKYEQENYSRKVDRYGNVLEEPEDMDNHIAGDPVRYVAMHLQGVGVIKASRI